KGFDVKLEIAPQEPDSLSSTDQLWLFSGKRNSPTILAAVEKHVESGKGLYLLADNPPFTFEANVLAKKLFGTQVDGSYLGMLMAHVHRKGAFPGAMPK